MSTHASTARDPANITRRTVTTGVPGSMMRSADSSGVGMRARTVSSTAVTRTPTLSSCAIVPPGHGSFSGSGIGVPLTMSKPTIWAER